MFRLSSLVVLLVSILAEASPAQINVWRLQNPLIIGNTLQGVQMISAATTVACGNDASFVKTIDGGSTWIAQSRILGLGGNFYALSFLNANFGMICGDGGNILKTTDGGNTWTILHSATKVTFNSIAVIDTNIAIVIGKAATILRTTDGGNNWLPIPFEIQATFANVKALRPNFVTVVGKNGILYKSLDSGRSWQKMDVRVAGIGVTNDFLGQVFFDDNTATLVGSPGEILRTTDGGQSWVKQILSDSIYLTVALKQVDGKNPDYLVIVGDYGTILSTTDGGTHWYRRTAETLDSLNGISFLDKRNATAVGRDGMILHSIDGGITWQFLPRNPLLDPLAGVAFPKGDTSLGIAVGYYGSILRTTNGGELWDKIPSGTTSYLKGVSFLDPKNIIVVGEYGTLLRSSDAGLTWSKVQSGTTKHLESVSFGTQHFGWCVGDSGIAMHTEDAGKTWTIYPFSKKFYFSSVCFPDSLHGYIGSKGLYAQGLYVTTDGGDSWDNPDGSYYATINGLHAPSANMIAIVGTLCINGNIGTSHDGGSSWHFGNVNGLLNAVYFSDDQHGTVVGDFGVIYHTSDGGSTWKSQSVSADNLESVSFGTAKAGSTVGLRGNILRITTDE